MNSNRIFLRINSVKSTGHIPRRILSVLRHHRTAHVPPLQLHGSLSVRCGSDRLQSQTDHLSVHCLKRLRIYFTALCLCIVTDKEPKVRFCYFDMRFVDCSQEYFLVANGINCINWNTPRVFCWSPCIYHATEVPLHRRWKLCLFCCNVDVSNSYTLNFYRLWCATVYFSVA